jgi:hypothetical protein
MGKGNQEVQVLLAFLGGLKRSIAAQATEERGQWRGERRGRGKQREKISGEERI